MVDVFDWNDLEQIQTDPELDYVLQNDLDSSTDGYAGIGNDWDGRAVGEFTGTFDGQGNTIQDLILVNSTGEDNQAFISSLGEGILSSSSDAEIKNLTLDLEFESDGNFSIAGGLTTTANIGTHIENCIVNVDMDLPNCDNVSPVVAASNAGIVENTAAFGSVVGGDDVTGFVGNVLFQQDVNALDNCYSLCNLSSSDRVGGMLIVAVDGAFRNVFYAGNMNGQDRNGVVEDAVAVNVENVYWDIIRSETRVSDRGIPLSTALMTGDSAIDEMDGLDYDTEWQIVEDGVGPAVRDGYPVIQSLDIDKQVELQNADEPLPEFDEWGVFDQELGETVSEVRTFDSLELVIRYTSEQKSLVRTLLNGSDNVEKLERSEGGFVHVDTGTGASVLNFRAPADRNDLRTVDEWLVEEYNDSVIDKTADTFELELTLLPRVEKSFDNEFGSFDEEPSFSFSPEDYGFSLEFGGFSTTNVSADLSESDDGTTSEYSLTMVLNREDARLVEENFSHLNLVTRKDVPKADDLIVDESFDGRNTVDITLPDDADGPFSEGEFVVKEWEVEWIGGAYMVEMIVGES